MVIAFVPWIVASVLIYALGSLRHLRAIQTVAFIATFLGILFCILTYRSTYPAARPAPKFGFTVTAWSTIVAGLLYLIMTWGQ